MTYLIRFLDEDGVSKREEFVTCGECMALVPKRVLAEHQDWHQEHRRYGDRVADLIETGGTPIEQWVESWGK